MDINGGFGDNKYATRVGHWALNESSNKEEFILDGEFDGTNYDLWKERLENEMREENERRELNTILGISGIVASGAGTAWTLAETALGVSCPPVGISLGVASTALSLYTYLANTYEFNYEQPLPDISTHSHIYTTGLSYEFNPVTNLNIGYYYGYRNWPVVAHIWTYAGIHVDDWHEDSQEKFTLKFSTVLSAKRPYTYQEPMNVKVGFSYPIVIKKAEGYEVKSDDDMYVEEKEIYPKPIKVWIPANEMEDKKHNKIYEGLWKDVDINVSSQYLTQYTRLRVEFGDGKKVDISTDTDIKYKDSSITIFEMKHRWFIDGDEEEEDFFITAFYYKMHLISGQRNGIVVYG